MKFSIALSVVLLAVSVSGFNSTPLIQGAITDINNQLAGLKTLFNNYYFTNANVANYFANIDTDVTGTPAYNHIYNTRNNYVGIVNAVNLMITTSRANVVANIDSKYEIVDSKFPIADQTATDVNNVLISRGCTDAQVGTFIGDIVSQIQSMVQNEINEIISSYQSLIFSGQVPLYLLGELKTMLVDCKTPTTDNDSVSCLMRKEQLYQTNYVNLIGASFHELQRTFIAFNNQITTNLLQKVDADLLQAYHDALTHTC